MFYYMQNLNHVLWLHPGLLKVTYDAKRKSHPPRRPDLIEVTETVNDDLNFEESAGARWKMLIILKAITELSGSFDRRLGYIIDVTKISMDGISMGKTLPQTGFIEYNITYDAIVQFPMQGEVIEAEVVKILKTKIIFCFVGYVYGVVPYENFCQEDDFEYKEVAEIGENDEAKLVPTFTSLGCSPPITIKVGEAIRLKIVSRRFGNTGFWLVGSMDNKHLGPPREKLLNLNLNRKPKKTNSVDNVVIDNATKSFLHLA